MTDPALGAWLRRERKEQRGWSQLEMARRLIRAARDTPGEDPVPGADSIKRRINRWEHSYEGVSLRYRRLYCIAFGIPLPQFGHPTDTAPPEAPPAPADGAVPASALLPPPPAMTYRGRQEPVAGEFALGLTEVVAMAAHESSDYAGEYEQGISDTTSEQLRSDVIRLARQTDTHPPLPVFLDLRRVRDRIYRLLDRRYWPREQTELHFLLGVVNGLMGVAARQLGYPDAAEELFRAGYASAAGIDHNPLRAMLRLKLAGVMYHRGRYGESRDLAADGLRFVSQGSLGAELHTRVARAATRLGDLDTTRQAVSLADEARDSDYRDDLLEIGGYFTVSRATHLLDAGCALANASGAEPDATAKLEQAIGLYDAGPGEEEEFWFAGKPMAGATLALVRLRSGALDAATAALEPALVLPPEQRISDITDRLADVRRELTAPIFQGSPQARDLGEAIETFTREAVTTGLRSLTG